MKYIPESVTVVIAGFWNTNIFSPDWLNKYIIKAEDGKINVEYSLQPGAPAPLRYRKNNIIITPESNRLVITASSYDNESLILAENYAKTFIDLLPHTPIIGIGYNFELIEEKPETELLNFFNFKDNEYSNKLGDELINTQISRQYKNSEYDLNFNLQQNIKTGLTFGFNYHYQINNNIAEFKDKMVGKFISNRDKTLKILEEIYSLELEGDNE